MPGEHEPHEAIWLAWPVRSDNWREKGKPAQNTFIEVAKTIAQSTKVVLVADADHFHQAQKAVQEAMSTSKPGSKSIQVVELPYNDSWLRDSGATYVINKAGERRAVSWQFNAWGGELDGLYSPWDLDDAFAPKMAESTGDSYYQAPFILEGGSIHSDGEGTLYTTEECLLHPSRNPHLSKMEIESLLKDYLGVSKIIWLKKGLYNDETNGHIDNILHVIRPGVVALTWCEDPQDPQYQISHDAYEVLSKEVDAKGRQLEIIKLPLPGPLYMTEEEASTVESSEGMERAAGNRLGASYANFLITNQSVIFPLLDKEKDTEATHILQNAFPGYNILGIPAREIVLGGGNIHCITQQVPCY